MNENADLSELIKEVQSLRQEVAALRLQVEEIGKYPAAVSNAIKTDYQIYLGLRRLGRMVYYFSVPAAKLVAFRKQLSIWHHYYVLSFARTILRERTHRPIERGVKLIPTYLQLLSVILRSNK